MAVENGEERDRERDHEGRGERPSGKRGRERLRWRGVRQRGLVVAGEDTERGIRP